MPTTTLYVGPTLTQDQIDLTLPALREHFPTLLTITLDTVDGARVVRIETSGADDDPLPFTTGELHAAFIEALTAPPPIEVAQPIETADRFDALDAKLDAVMARQDAIMAALGVADPWTFG